MEHTMSATKTSSRTAMWIIIGGFSVVLMANVTLIYFAVNTWTGIETEQHYVKGLNYNSNLEGAKRQQALGWQADFGTEFVKGDNLSGLSEIRFTDKNGQPVTGLDVRVLITRPILEGYDQEIAFSDTGEGVYHSSFTLPLKGQWDFRILARRGEDNYQRVERIVTP